MEFYFAMTPGEMANAVPRKKAYMACHFSPWGPGLSNGPRALPQGSMLILDDSTPAAGHDPETVLRELGALAEEFRAEAVLLDFQRTENPLQAEIAEALAEGLPCPVGIPPDYAKHGKAAVFLPPPPPDTALPDYLAPWQGREIWLEAGLTAEILTLTEQGCRREEAGEHFPEGFADQALCCHYKITEIPEGFRFHLWRTPEDLKAMLRKAGELGVTRSVGLYQELGSYM